VIVNVPSAAIFADVAPPPRNAAATAAGSDATPVGHLLHSTLGSNGWTSYSDIFVGTSAREVELASDERGTLHLIASVRRSNPRRSAQNYDVVVSEFVARSAAAR